MLEVRAIGKKKGNTLVELIAAVALILIALQAVSLAVKASSTMWTRGNMKLDTSTFNHSITQDVKNRGKNYVKSIHSEMATMPGTIKGFYIYFNDYNEIAPFFEREFVNIDGSYKFTFESTLDYATCSSKNSSNKKYGAMITIEDTKNATDKYSIYYITVETWIMEQNGKYSSTASFYIGG